VFTTILLMRTREEYVSTPGNRHAVRVGLRETAAATTGAGLLMVAALIPFSTSDFIVIRALGVGIAVAVLLDVVLVRPVLLPAAEAVLGRYGWWPTTAPSAAAPPASESATTDLPRRRLPRPRLRHRPPGPAS
jgi:RND superfamily putative drug exporter